MENNEERRLAELRNGLLAVLDEAMRVGDAACGKIRVFNPQSGTLEIKAQRGFSEEFVDTFEAVKADEPLPCTRAFQLRRRITVPDVNTDPLAATYRPVAGSEGFRALQCTPILDSAGRPVGTLSTHFPRVQQTSTSAGLVLDYCSKKAGGLIEALFGPPRRFAPDPE